MQAFVWDARFVTGLESVDSQHCHLVDLINQVGDLLLGGQVDEARLESLFRELAEYANYHFSEEERLMEEVGVDPRHAAPHKGHHAEFIKQVQLMWRGRGSSSDPIVLLHDFLVAWLTVHILGEDQVMGRIIRRIREGQAPGAAYEAESMVKDNRVSALLDALHKLYHVVSLQNRDLAEANEGLEEKVAERTGELEEANRQLTAEHEELRQLLRQVAATHSQLLQAEEMAAVGRLAAGVAHEINNPLGFVNSNLGTLKSYADTLLGLAATWEKAEAALPAGPFRDALAKAREAADLGFLREDIGELLRESRNGLDRVFHIVRQLKGFSHVDEAEVQQTDLNAGLENSLQVAWHELKDKAEVVRDYGTIPLVRCIAAQINQVFFNLLVNAAQSFDQRGTVTLRTRHSGDWVEVEIADTGRGMTQEALRQAFVPFYTTRPVGGGMGLGLSVAYDIVSKHGGRIEAEGQPGRGTTFRIYLPVAGPQPQG